MKIALAQTDILWHDRAGNLAAMRSMAMDAAGGGADIVVFPEMCTSGFSMDLAAAAEEIPDNHPCGSVGETGSALEEMARVARINLIAGIAYRVEGDTLGRNTALFYTRDGDLQAAYVKMQPFALAGEHLSYEAGTQPVAARIDDIPASVFICYDLRFPELFRMVARKVSLIFVLANWPASRAEHWSALLKARAIENQCFVIGVNRTGTDGNRIAYAGGSQVYGPRGELVASAGAEAGITLCEIDPSEVARVRAEFPFLKDMKRPWDEV